MSEHSSVAEGQLGETRTDNVHNEPKEPRTRDADASRFVVFMSLRLLIISVATSALLAFALGRIARFRFISREQALMDRKKSWNQANCYDWRAVPDRNLPSPKVEDGKEVPHTIYTSKSFVTGTSATSSNLLASPREKPEGTNSNYSMEGTEIEDDAHLPLGDHFTADMIGVESAFLNSELRLADALLDTCAEVQMTVLSYHCHKIVPMGVNCIGILLKGHISFRTWPAEGVIIVDLFTSGTSKQTSVLDVIERQFGVPRAPKYPEEHVEPPNTLWACGGRGIRDGVHENDVERFLGDMGLEFKKRIASIESEYQEIDVIDVIRNDRHDRIADYKKSLENNGSYQTQHPELFSPDRIVFLGNVMQSTKSGEAAYHESLVHPAMFAHANPERVAIVGGGEGATLREVLKHRTVKNAVMVEIDEEMAEASVEYLPSWSDCSNLIGSANVCFDDPRATTYYEDALAWFIDRYSAAKEEELSTKRLQNSKIFDVIIIDALDPNYDIEFSDELYTKPRFLRSLYNALSEDGVMVIQTGEAPDMHDPPDSVSPFRNRAILTHLLETIGFESVLIYEEAHSALEDEWCYLIAFKDHKTRRTWYANEAQVELAMQKRAMPTKSGHLPFYYFDGATMLSYQYAHKAYEMTFCHQKPTPKECDTVRGYNASKPNAPISSFEMQVGGAEGARSDSGVFTKDDIAEGAYIALEKGVEAVRFSPSTLDLVTDLFSKHGQTDALNSVSTYMHDYGFESDAQGGVLASVDSSIVMHVNHGYNGTYNVDRISLEGSEVTEMREKTRLRSRVFNPVVDRNLAHSIGGTKAALRKIHSGEEVLRRPHAICEVSNEPEGVCLKWWWDLVG